MDPDGGRHGLASRAAFQTNADRVANRAALDATLEPIFAAATQADMIAALKSGGIAFARDTTVAELPNHPALRRMDMTLPGGKTKTMPRPAGHPASLTAGPVPQLGAHTDAIRRAFGAESPTPE